MTDDFHTLILEGLFYYHDGQLSVVVDGSVRDVNGVLDALHGMQVQLLLHFVPDASRATWGRGSCFWEPHGTCPCGHHDHPDMLVNFTAKGVMQREGDGWVIESGGTIERVPIGTLNGHTGRIIVATVFDPDARQSGSVSDLRHRVEMLRNWMNRITVVGRDPH